MQKNIDKEFYIVIIFLKSLKVFLKEQKIVNLNACENIKKTKRWKIVLLI